MSRLHYYDWLASNIQIDGITHIARDTAFDDEKYRSGGIRLFYPTKLTSTEDIKDGILLEVGFDSVAPNTPVTISSWAYDYASKRIALKDNRALDVPCYHPGYTLVEKLQTISTKFRKQQELGMFSENFMRHYYDVYQLLGDQHVLRFIGTRAYLEHKKERFRASDIQNIEKNQAFQLNDPDVFSMYNDQYQMSQSLYYKEKPSFLDIMSRIRNASSLL
jgi:hypothetical protein